MNKIKVKDQLHELRNELAYIRGMLENVSHQMQELRESIGVTSNQDQMLRMSQSYEHPWHQHIRQRPISGRSSDESPEVGEYYEAITTRLGFSGGTTPTQGPSH
jgi:signal transduction histidine kinase